MPLDLTRETRIYLAMWKKAGEAGTLSISLRTETEAKSTRMALYRAIKPFKDERLYDPVLKEIGLGFAIVIEKGSKVLTIRPRKDVESAELLSEMFGLSEDDLAIPEEKALRDRLAGEVSELKGDPKFKDGVPLPPLISESAVPNKFFTREKP